MLIVNIHNYKLDLFQGLVFKVLLLCLTNIYVIHLQDCTVIVRITVLSGGFPGIMTQKAILK